MLYVYQALSLMVEKCLRLTLRCLIFSPTNSRIFDAYQAALLCIPSAAWKKERKMKNKFENRYDRAKLNFFILQLQKKTASFFVNCFLLEFYTHLLVRRKRSYVVRRYRYEKKVHVPLFYSCDFLILGMVASLLSYVLLIHAILMHHTLLFHSKAPIDNV